MNNPIYEIENLDYKKNNNLLLRIKKFEIHRGACYLFKGEMGSGKTLLLNILNKNNRKYNGTILFEGKDLKKINNKTYSSDISIVHQIQKRPF